MSSLDDLMQQSEGYEPSADTMEDAQQALQLKQYDLVQLVVSSIEPRREELQAISGTIADPIAEAPWKSGIALKLIAMRVKRREQADLNDPSSPEVLKDIALVEGDVSNVVFNFSPFGIRQFEQLRTEDIEKGFLRIYNDEGKTAKVTGFDPPDFMNATPQERFAFWWKMISRKFGCTRGLRPGDAFWAYCNLTYSKAKNPDGSAKYDNAFKNFYKSLKHQEKQAILEAPMMIEQISLPFVRAINGKIEDAYAELERRKNAGNDATPF